jgi:hypothetical protein
MFFKLEVETKRIRWSAGTKERNMNKPNRDQDWMNMACQ